MKEKDRLILEGLYLEITKEQRLEMIKQLALKHEAPPRRLSLNPSTYKAAIDPIEKIMNHEDSIRRRLMNIGYRGERLEQKVAQKMNELIKSPKNRD